MTQETLSTPEPQHAPDKLPSEATLPAAQIHEYVGEPYRVDPIYIDLINAELKAGENVDNPESLSYRRLYDAYVSAYRATVTDPLTGLLNRKGMGEWFEKNKPEKFAIFFADAIGFGKINKEISYEAGDQVIKYIGSQLDTKFRTKHKEPESSSEDHSSDRSTQDGVGAIMRWGGDEFVIVVDLSSLMDATEEEVQAVIDSIQARLMHLGSYDYETPEGVRKIPVSLRSDVVVGKASDNKTLDQFHAEIVSIQDQVRRQKEDEALAQKVIVEARGKINDLTAQ